MSISSHPQKDIPRRRRSHYFSRRGVRWAFALLSLALVLLPLLFFRLSSDARKLVRCDYSDITTNVRTFENGQSPTLRIATWNIAHGRGSGDSNWEEGGEPKRDRVGQIAEKIQSFDADVVILNEVDFSASWSGGNDQAEQIAMQAGYPICIKQANLDFGFLLGRWYFGNAILSRFPLSDAHVVELKPLNRWESWLVGNKRGVSCRVELPNGDRVSVVGLHLESRGEAIRVKQVDDVARHLGTLGSPIVVAGDLNTTPSQFPNSQLDADGVNAFDKLISQTQFSYQDDSANRSAGPASNRMTYSTLQPKLVIDWVLLSDGLSVVDQQTIATELSDHRPVVAAIEIKESQN
jgi:endonuclease/exonuclease/phosphatase family metal-dependent hydrolase